MKAAFYSGASGLRAHQEALDNIGNNIANANTTGFKTQTVAFEDLLYDRMYAEAPSQPKNGHGTKAVNGGIKFGQGIMTQTGGMLDFAISGDGFFGIMDVNGNKAYTRDGAFGISLTDGATLVTQSGEYVLDEGGNKITLSQVGEDEGYDYAKLMEEIGIYRFGNPYALQPAAGNKYVPTEKSGQAKAVTDNSNTLHQAYLEGSGTSMVDEMTNMIAAQRSYQLSARVVQTADEIEQIVSNLRK